MDDRPGDHAHAPGQRHPDAGWGSPVSGPRLEEFRRLAHDLDTRARRAHQLAASHRADSSQAGVQLLRDLQHFTERTAAVHRQADADRLDPEDVGPVVQHLLDDARKADRSMRQARVYESTWNEWTATIRVLERMVAALR